MIKEDDIVICVKGDFQFAIFQIAEAFHGAYHVCNDFTCEYDCYSEDAKDEFLMRVPERWWKNPPDGNMVVYQVDRSTIVASFPSFDAAKPFIDELINLRNEYLKSIRPFRDKVEVWLKLAGNA